MSSRWLDQAAIKVPVGGTVAGVVRPPSSKSVSHRMMNLAMLSGGPHRIKRLLAAVDLDLFRAAFAASGWDVSGDPSNLLLVPPKVASTDVPLIDCGNAGTMFRFMVATRCVVPGIAIVDGTERLRERPIAPLVSALRQLGARIEFLGQEGCAPLKIYGGQLKPGTATLDASESSQYLSALLMACSFLLAPSEIQVSALVSTPYVEVTLAALRRFGMPLPTYQAAAGGAGGTWNIEPPRSLSSAGSAEEPREFSIEADYSAAAYPAAAAMISGGVVEICGLDPHSPQGDRKFLEVLVQAGGEMEWINANDPEGGIVRFQGRPRRAIDVDLGDMPDQVPTLAAVAAFCPGRTIIRNVAHLRIKESDRLRAVALEWSKIGIKIRETADGLEIEGRPEWLDHPVVGTPCEIATYDDHRIAMSAALVGLRRAVLIQDPAVVAKSYPEFWSDFFRLLPD